MPAEHAARHRAISTVLTSLGQVATLLAAGIMGVLIAHRFGSDARTDGFFTANSIYGIALFVATSLRATAVPRLVAGAGDDTELSRHMRAIGVMAAAAAALFVVIGVAIIPAVTSSLPAAAEHTARLSLALLWPACALQLFCGLAAAKLAVLDDYQSAAFAYAAGACSNVIAFVILTPIFAVEGVPLALVGGAAVTAVILSVGLARRHVRIIPRRVPGGRRTAGRLILGATALISAQIVLVISVAFAAHTGEGQATLYSYAMSAIMILTAGLVSPITIVFAPVVARAGGAAGRNAGAAVDSRRPSEWLAYAGRPGWPRPSWARTCRSHSDQALEQGARRAVPTCVGALPELDRGPTDDDPVAWRPERRPLDCIGRLVACRRRRACRSDGGCGRAWGRRGGGRGRRGGLVVRAGRDHKCARVWRPDARRRPACGRSVRRRSCSPVPCRS